MSLSIHKSLIIYLSLISIMTVTIDAQCDNRNIVNDFKRYSAIKTINENKQKYKKFLDTVPHIENMISEYEESNCVIINKTFTESKQDIIILIKYGVPSDNIKILHREQSFLSCIFSCIFGGIFGTIMIPIVLLSGGAISEIFIVIAFAIGGMFGGMLSTGLFGYDIKLDYLSMGDKISLWN